MSNVNTWPSTRESRLAPLLRALRAFRRQCRVTPALRERCIDCAIRAGSTGGHIEHQADRIAVYIAGNER